MAEMESHIVQLCVETKQPLDRIVLGQSEFAMQSEGQRWQKIDRRELKDYRLFNRSPRKLMTELKCGGDIS